ncbi:(Fe-S)-binding protein [Nitrospina watsonii]|uniref:Iron-sulfur-binding oxidoreductase FadF n=1 Tax=Nitrospina watsonii TaxID=1323948 RepID=A0ABM9HF99_9BACT|nr:(Fe-S)-binding protein [Nitrospina watsonii]CAI2718938.1 putative iron-sulfur-binding oxidoreductase FadF [Nitrospina watsonii]
MDPTTPGGVPPTWHPWVLGLATLVSGIVFIYALWPKWQVLRRAQPDSRLDRPAARILHTLKVAFAQSKMFKDRNAGWMHAFIFWGFLVLLLRAAEFFLIGFFPKLEAPAWLDAPRHLYYAVKDGFVVLVTAACLYALHRRLVVKPKRLNLSGEGILILVLILVIMLSDMVYEGARQVLLPDTASAWSWLGYLVAQSGLSGMSRPALETMQAVGYWSHVLAILFFLDLLPRSKHFHVITSIPNVFFSPVTPGNQLHRMDFEDEDQESFGVNVIEEFSWKKLLDLHTCTECGRCDVFCPALNSQKPLSPKQFTIDLRDHLNARTPQLLKAEPEPGPAVMGSVILDETVWSCTTCGACEEECPVMIEYVNKMIDLRRGMVLMESRFPKELNDAFKSLETHSNPWGFPGTSRADWAASLDVPQWDKNNPTEYLYFPGCNGAFDNRGKTVAASVVKTLKAAGVSFSILGNREGCTGDPARRLGNEYLFDMLATHNAETFKEEGVVKVVTHCPHCFNSFKNEYPEYGVHLEVIHHSQLFADLLKNGRLKLQPTDDKVVYHDSCYMGRHNKEYEAPRQLLAAAVLSGSLKEVETSRERGTCCGAGGGRFLLEENTGTRMSHNRVDELMQTEPETIAVSCPFCVLMIEDALKAKNLNEKVRVRDISEMIVEKQ